MVQHVQVQRFEPLGFVVGADRHLEAVVQVWVRLYRPRNIEYPVSAVAHRHGVVECVAGRLTVTVMRYRYLVRGRLFSYADKVQLPHTGLQPDIIFM